MPDLRFKADLLLRQQTNLHRLSSIIENQQAQADYTYDANGNRIVSGYCKGEQYVSPLELSLAVPATNTISSNGIVVALHEIAQLNFLKESYKDTHEMPRAEVIIENIDQIISFAVEDIILFWGERRKSYV